MDKPRRRRLTLGGMILLVAVAAFLIDVIRPKPTRIVDVKLGAGLADLIVTVLPTDLLQSAEAL